MKSASNLTLVLMFSCFLSGSFVLPSAFAGSDKKSDSGSDSSKSSSKSSSSDSSSDDSKKVTICHLPPGNPGNGQTLEISENAWKTGVGSGGHKEGGHGGDYLGECKKNITICHKKENGDYETTHIGFTTWQAYREDLKKTGKKGDDYLGSCYQQKQEQTDKTFIIKGCTGNYRETLLELTQSYYDPIVISDEAYDDKEVVIAISQCLNHGDSDDSTKADSNKGDSSKDDSGKKDDSNKGDSNKDDSDGSKNSDSVKGGAHDSVSDSGKHHRIHGCRDIDKLDSNHDSNDSDDSNDSNDSNGKDESDSSKNYNKKLRERTDSFNDSNDHGDSSINVSDSSMDDSDVYNEMKKCAAANKDSDSGDDSDSGSDSYSDSNTDSGIKGRGDSGHKYKIVNDCANAKDIKDEIKAHRAAMKDDDFAERPIVLKESSLSDKNIKAAVDACIDKNKGEGEQLWLPPSSSGSAGIEGRLNWKEKSQ